MKYYDREIYGLPSMGFRIAKVIAEKFDYGMLDETNCSRIFKFFLDDQTEPTFLAYQYAKNTKIYIYQNLNQPKVSQSNSNNYKEELMEMYNIGYLGCLEGNMTNTKFWLYDYQVDSYSQKYLPDKLYQPRDPLVIYS